MKRLFILTCLMALFILPSMAIDQINGVYQIKTAQDLVDFSSNVVGSGNSKANALLTNDIDMAGITFSPIGNEQSKYAGTFDGGCHIIHNLTINTPEKSKVGLFGVVSDGAYIKNLIIDENSTISGNDYVGAFVGSTDGNGSITLENVGNKAAVAAAGANAAGLVGVSMMGQCAINIIHCFNMGTIVGSKESASFCGWFGSGSTIQDSYSFADVIGSENGHPVYRNSATIKGKLYDKKAEQGDPIDENDLYSGAFAYLLNGSQSDTPIWFQTLTGDNADICPVPFNTHGVVYANGSLNCDGTPKSGTAVTYSNTNESKRDPHQFKNGICTVCGSIQRDYVTADNEGFYPLSTPEQLNWFAIRVNKGEQNIKGRLTADIDFSAYQTMIGGTTESTAFTGQFDGQGHKVTVAYKGTDQRMGLFRYVVGKKGDTTTGVIRNLMTEGSMTVGRMSAGLISTITYGAIENCVSNVTLTYEGDGDATIGGLVAVANRATIINNCAFTGTLNATSAEGNGGLIGWADGGTEITINNSYVSGQLNVLNGSYFNRKPAVLNNCYYVKGKSNDIAQDTDADSRATLLDDATVASGELAFRLNASVGGGTNWYQTLGTDAFPLPFATSSKVYPDGNLSCDGTPKAGTTYTNTEGQATTDPHKLNENGECTVCGNRVLSKGSQLVALQDDQANGLVKENVKVELANDIDMQGINGFTGIGTRTNPFKGTFDGKHHHIQNMVISSDDGNTGLFAHVTGGTSIKNLTIDKTCDIYGAKGWSAAVIGVVLKSNNRVELENVGNEANVTTEGPNAAGIIGVCEGSTIHMKNVYNAGTITGAKESAAISGWLTNYVTLENVYNCGEVGVTGLDGSNTFARFQGDKTIVNCYETKGTQVTTATQEQVSNGELCYLLNGKVDNSTRFYQTLGKDAHPLLDPTHKTVYKNGDTYANGTSTGISLPKTSHTNTTSGIYTVNGVKVSTLQKGINLVRTIDGKVKKVLVK